MPVALFLAFHEAIESEKMETLKKQENYAGLFETTSDQSVMPYCITI
jgi:hypothetical protein